MDDAGLGRGDGGAGTPQHRRPARRARPDLHHRTLHDPLTGLPNRDLLLDRLALALQRAERHHTQLAVLFLDLDDFKLINDSLGHAAGDHLLVAVGQRLNAQLRGTDTAARFGGDEFVLVCEDLIDARESTQIADRINAALRPPFTIDGRDITVTASIGIAVPPSTTHPPDQLLQDADQAMYRAKARGGGRFDLFNDVLRDHAIHRLNTKSTCGTPWTAASCGWSTSPSST